MHIDYDQLRNRIASSTKPTPPEDSAPRLAAVLALFVEREGTNLLFIRRADRGDPWSNHIAFPGGHIDPTDADASAAALRETHEEVGIEADAICGLGDLGTFPTQLPKLFVRVCVGRWRGEPGATANPAEVAEVFEVPVETLLERQLAEGFDTMSAIELGARLTYPVPQGTIWGVTARILHHLLGFVA
jgi:8-oxo-dGTP pyrophosphatase MutT (NUDIX family)